jgi:hypothetical protein
MPQPVLFNVIMQPSSLFAGERQTLQEIKNRISKADPGNTMAAVHIPWVETILKRRLAAWKKFFTLQIHVIGETELDENLLRSIGSSLTRDTNDQPLPGFQIKWPDSETTGQSWRENILSMDFVPSLRMEDLADADETFAVFRFPYLSDAGLPGANFLTYREKSPLPQTRQG